MTIFEIGPELFAGKEIRRKGWQGGLCARDRVEAMMLFRSILSLSISTVINGEPEAAMTDFEADDWEVFE